MATKIPAFTTTCLCSTEIVDGVWYIYLKSSGSFSFSYSKSSVDIFLGGGGGGGATNEGSGNGAGGGAGGHLTTQYGQAISTSQYSIQIGSGGSANSDGGTTTAFGFSAEGGAGAPKHSGGVYYGATDGTGAGGDGGIWGAGSNTANAGEAGQNGQLAFGEGSVYYGAGGGGGGSKFASGGAGGITGGGNGGTTNTDGSDGSTNTCSGGGGGGGVNIEAWSYGGTGGSGIIILRGTEDDFLPVFFNGRQLQEIYLNGELLKGLIYGGRRLFARVMNWLRIDRRQAAAA